jgi:hypothetical protein
MIVSLNILEKPITQIPTSEEFLAMANRNHFENLAQILEFPVHKMERFEGFNYHILDELIMILKANNLLDRLKEN